VLLQTPIFNLPWKHIGFQLLYSSFASCRYGFGAYFNVLPGSEWSALMLTYGFPVAVIGMALKVKILLVYFPHVGYIIHEHVATYVKYCKDFQ